jgi:hypothetical protein
VTSNYHPEPYWNDVAKRIAARPGSKLLAGDDEPYYQYKRQQFLKLLHALPFRNKTVLEQAVDRVATCWRLTSSSRRH